MANKADIRAELAKFDMGGGAQYEYFEYDGHALVMCAVPPYMAAYIWVNGDWESRNLNRNDPSLFPMSDEEALDIIKNGYPK